MLISILQWLILFFVHWLIYIHSITLTRWKYAGTGRHFRQFSRNSEKINLNQLLKHWFEVSGNENEWLGGGGGKQIILISETIPRITNIIEKISKEDLVNVETLPGHPENFHENDQFTTILMELWTEIRCSRVKMSAGISNHSRNCWCSWMKGKVWVRSRWTRPIDGSTTPSSAIERIEDRGKQ